MNNTVFFLLPLLLGIPIISAYSTTSFFPPEYDISIINSNSGLLMIDAHLVNGDESYQVVIWDVTSLQIDENFWGDRGSPIDDFAPANCIIWTEPEEYNYSLSCIYEDTYEVFVRNSQPVHPYEMMEKILAIMESSKSQEPITLQETTESDTLTQSQNNADINLEPEDSTENGGCLIATATFGTELAPQVQHLREIRDNTLLSTVTGTAFMAGFNQLYYSFSPTIADLERQNLVFKEFVKISITPMLSTLSVMEFAESESEVLGYGLGVILLNVGMYLGLPLTIVFRIKKLL